MASPMPHTQKATSWDAWQIGLKKAKKDVMAEADGNSTETTEVRLLVDIVDVNDPDCSQINKSTAQAHRPYSPCN